MELMLPKEVQDGLDAARRSALKRASRLRIRAGDAIFPVLRSWQDGFSLEVENVPALRGRIGLYDGERLLSYCLIIASEEEGEEIRYEYKRMTDASEIQPLDFYRPAHAPVALIAGPLDH